MMTNRKLVTEQQATERLSHALNTPDELSCAVANDLILALVEAERAGKDVDSDPQFAALLRHLDDCEECMALYVSLAENLELLGNEESLPPATRPAPSFFGPVYQSENAVLRILKGLKQRFHIDITTPPLRLTQAVLSPGRRVSLFSNRVSELAGNPLVAIALELEADAPTLMVAVRGGMALSQWQVEFQIGDHSYTGKTDARGIAQISGFSIEQLQQADRLSLVCTEELATQP